MFFKVENGLLVLDKEEIRNISVFKAILERDKGSDGDNDGRKKYRAFKEFYYIWWLCNVKSPGVLAGYNDKELHLQGIKEARLEDTFKPDKLIKEAITYYKEEQAKILISSTSVTNLIRAVRLSDTLTQRLTASMELILEADKQEQEERDKLSEEGKELPPIDLIKLVGRTSALLGQFSQIAEIAKKVPALLATLEEVSKKLKVEESGSATVRGGQRKGNRMD